MSDEKPIGREEARAMADQLIAAMQSGAPHADIDLAGQKLEFNREEDGGFTIMTPGMPVGMRAFAPAPERPAGYPDDLPFVPGELVTVGGHEGSRFLMWWRASDPQATFDELERQSAAEGWSTGGRSQLEPIALTTSKWSRGGEERHLMLAAGILSLIQAPAR